MAKRSILVSDISGEEVTEENGVNLRATFPGSDKAAVLDITKTEFDGLFTDKKTGEFVGRYQEKRGRKAGENGSDSSES
jgi:hypothetical protein